MYSTKVEPKYNINCTAFNGEWGRPQNDGPALRGIILFKLINLLNYKYDNLIDKLIIPVIKKDLDYIISNYDKTSYDIWEEKKGWHFYTRMVQTKFIKDSILDGRFAWYVSGFCRYNVL